MTPAPPEVLDTPDPTVSESPDRPIRTVLADDVADLRTAVTMALELDGRFEIVGEAATGTEAVALASATRPDLMLLDLTMPDMDGLEALPQILDVSPSTRVVILTAHAADSLRDACRDLGAVGYLEKVMAGRHIAQQVIDALDDAG